MNSVTFDLPNIKYLNFTSFYASKNPNLYDILPSSLEELIICNFINFEINNLPNNIKKLIFRRFSIFNEQLNCLPESLEYLELPKCYSKKISKFAIQNIINLN